MISETLLKDLNFIRETLTDSFDRLEKSPSFTTIINSSASSKQNYEALTRISDKLKTPFENKFVSAIIGSSKNGKTTVMDEMFPDLSKRGWLVTAVNDTTSQALRIEYARQTSEKLNEVVVNSWNIDQIKGLFNSDYVEGQNQEDNIRIFYKDDSIEVDGSEATFSKEDLKEFKFSLKQTAKPFPFPFKVPEDKLSDESFIEALTIKQARNRLQTDNLLTVGNNSYNSLQLRAVVKDVSLKDRFDEIKKWTGLSDNEISSLVFIDTPGLATDGSVKDEVLRHPLAVKSNQIVLELLKNDELDIIIHLVLCADQSKFTKLWEALENECGAIGMEDLSERLVLAINGTNIYFHDKNMKKEVASGEHFEMSIEDNILLKMSPRGRIQPAKICFLDSRKYIEGSGGPFSKPKYEKIYQNNREIMSEWLTPNTKPYSYLEQMGMVDLFKENIEALCDPDDRGQGFLIRQIVNLIREKGPVLLLKKYLVRTNLLNTCEKLNKILSTYYDNDGKLNCQATKDAMQNCFSFLDKDDLFIIENFCAENIDPEIEGIIKTDESDENWIRKSFESICNILLRKIIDESGANRETAAIFKKFFKVQLEKWIGDWGYSTSHMKLNDRTFKLLMHSLRTHVREILYQFLTSSSLFGNLDSFTQTPEDRKEVENIIKELTRAVQKGNQLCIKYKIWSS
ncbi:MAG: hypothetical protein GY749_12405 [Desulfobacteraceae bacterium]|nr:hypothetical protein [Desulfobacteraceae bacterium]